MPEQQPTVFPANRDVYSREHGNEKFLCLLWKKVLGRFQRQAPFAGLRRLFSRMLGVRVNRVSGERAPWIAVEVFLDDTFPELVTLEPGCIIAVRAMLLCHDDARRVVAPVRVGRGAFIGAGAILLPGADIGEGAVIAAGAVVKDRVGPGETWGGVPAKKIADARLPNTEDTDNSIDSARP